MLELPETITIARQMTQVLTGKTINEVVVYKTPHKMMWFEGDPDSFSGLLTGRRVTGAEAAGGYVKLLCGQIIVSFQDGVMPHYHQPHEPAPERHQLYLRFDDGSALSAVVRMYGGIGVFEDGNNNNPYYLVAHQKPSPLSDAFTPEYFASLRGYQGSEKNSAKAFLATQQRIPGLGNGTLQDILWRAKVHPKRKLGTLSDAEFTALYHAVKEVLHRMAEAGGRDTERDLFGNPGGYQTVLSAGAENAYCPACGGIVKKESYMGGSVYYCEGCQIKA